MYTPTLFILCRYLLVNKNYSYGPGPGSNQIHTVLLRHESYLHTQKYTISGWNCYILCGIGMHISTIFADIEHFQVCLTWL